MHPSVGRPEVHALEISGSRSTCDTGSSHSMKLQVWTLSDPLEVELGQEPLGALCLLAWLHGTIALLPCSCNL